MSGTRSARRAIVRLAVVSAMAAAIAVFAQWAFGAWTDTGERIRAAQEAIAVAEARTTQAALYDPLREAWLEYAATDISGLVQSPTSRAAVDALSAQLQEIFERYDARRIRIEPLWRFGAADDPATEHAIDALSLEVLAEAPEDSLAGLLTSLETEPPYLFVDVLSLRRAPARADLAADEVFDAPVADGWIAVRVRVSAQRLAEAAE